jgi:predicted enzyme related to lactoylglutathione lyase
LKRSKIMAKPVVHFEVCGKDGAKTREFYSKLFGWEFEVVPEMDYGLTGPAAENSIGGGVGSTQGGAPPYVTFYVQTDDLQADLDKATALGGKVTVPPTEIPDTGTIAREISVKRFHELAVLALWAIALAATIVIVGDSARLTYLGPLFAICMIGSVMTVRSARRSRS